MHGALYAQLRRQSGNRKSVPFYQDFVYSHRIPKFFIEHYDHPIIEAGRQLTDMLYFKRDF